MNVKKTGLTVGVLMVASIVVAAVFYKPAKTKVVSQDSSFTIPYNLSNPQVIKLPQSLDEISGIVYSPQQDALLAIEDETGSLFSISPKKNYAVTNVGFGKKGDYEDVTLVNDEVYILSSNGNITSFDLSHPDKNTSFHFPQKGKMEFETLLYQPKTGKLLLFCKHCAKGDKGSVWEVDPRTGDYHASELSLQLKDVKGLKSKGLKPSAAAIHPRTGDIYLLSSVHKLLVVTDADCNVKGTQELNSNLYPQPEGICFLPNGDLFISNERNTAASATLLRINAGK